MNEADSRWQIILTRQAEKTLYRLSRSLLQRFDQTLLALAQYPRPPESRPLPGHDSLYRLAIAERWRLTYSVEEEQRSVLIVEIAPQQRPERYGLEEDSADIWPEEPARPDQRVSPGRIELAGLREFLSKSFYREELMTSIRRVYQSDPGHKRSVPSPALHRRGDFNRLKKHLRDRLLADLDLALDPSRSTDEVQRTLQEGFERLLAQENIVLSRVERDRLFEAVMGEILDHVFALEMTELEKIQAVSQVLAGEAGEPDEVQKRALAQWFRFFKLGCHLEISLSVADLSESLVFYNKLGLEKVDGGQKPYPWAVVSDGRINLGLHQQPFSSPTLSYFQLGILEERRIYLHKLGIRLENIQTPDPIQGMQHNELLDRVKFMTAEFTSPEGQRVLLADRFSDVMTTSTRRKIFGRNGIVGELALKTEDVKAAGAFWKQLGFECVAEGRQPYPWAVMSDGLIQLGFHQTPKLARPAIRLFTPDDMPERLKQLHQQGLKLVAEQKDKQGQRIGAVIESPDEQLFFLSTGEMKPLRRRES